MACRISSRHRLLFLAGRKLGDKEPGRPVRRSALAPAPHHHLLPFLKHREAHPLPGVQTSQDLGLLLLPVGNQFNK